MKMATLNIMRCCVCSNVHVNTDFEKNNVKIKRTIPESDAYPFLNP